MPNTDTLIIGLSQQTPTPLDVQGSLARLQSTVAQAADWGVQLLVVPEMCLTGYNITTGEIATVAQARDGALFESIATLAQQHTMAIAYGYAEHDNENRYYNAVQIIDSSGHSLSNYRKTHLWGELDRNLFSAGAALSSIVSVQGWNIATAICYDIEFPETARQLAINGAEVIVVPTGLMQPWREVAERVVPVRAYENRLFIAYTNYCGVERDITYEGYSSIVDPNGHSLAAAVDQPVLLTATMAR